MSVRSAARGRDGKSPAKSRARPLGPFAMAGARIGLFGGSFNPAHEGHVHVSLTALTRLKLDAVWWLVAPQNPLKASSDMAPLDRRMARARALARHPRFRVTALEDRLGTRFTIDTLKALKLRRPELRFVLVLGADSFADLDRWRAWTKIMQLVPVAVVARPGFAHRALASRAARRFARARLREEERARLFARRPPAWVYLNARQVSQSATALRQDGPWWTRTPDKRGPMRYI